MENDVDNQYPFTGDQNYDKLVIGFYLMRGIVCSIFFIINIPQCFYEYSFLKSKKGKLYSPRLFTFISISLFPLFRALNSFISVGLKDTRTGSTSWYFGIIGTCFLCTEFIYIGMFWVSILYTFFISDKIAFNNIKRSWMMANSFSILSFLWTFSLMIVEKEMGTVKTRSISSNGFIVMVSIIGTFILVNAVVLILFLRKQNSKSNTFRKSLDRTIKLAIILFVIVFGLVIRNIVSAILKIKDSSNSNYIFMFITFLLEIPQIAVVMSALANSSDEGCWKKYLTFQKVIKETSLELPKDTSFNESNKTRHNSIFFNTLQPSNLNNSNCNSVTISSESNNINSSGLNSNNSYECNIEMKEYIGLDCDLIVIDCDLIVV